MNSATTSLVGSAPNRWRFVAALMVAMGLALWPEPGAWLGAGVLHLAVMLLAMFGAPIQFTEHTLVVSTLRVPWSDECAGVAYFAILPLVACWSSWSAGGNSGLWRILGMPLVVACVINLLRVASIVLCRWWLLPEVESQQLHFFLGFVWLLPALWLLLPADIVRQTWLRALNLSAILAMLTPQLQAPGGALIAVVTALVLCLRLLTPIGNQRSAQGWTAHTLWFLAAGWIILSRMESLWLPWLLMWPELSPHRPRLLLWLLLPATLPLAAMHGLWSWLVFGPACLLAGRTLARRLSIKMPSNESVPRPWQAQALWTCVLLLPFVILNLGAHKEHPLDLPPSIIRSERIAEGRHVLHLSQQPNNMRVDWISPQQGGRHHTLRVCMAYRGEHLRCTEEAPMVFTDGHVWRSEFFLMKGHLLKTYRDYLLHSFLPGSGAGVHLIFSVNVGTMPVRDFESKARILAYQVHQQQQQALAFHP
jgi:exosortase/archaeosortase family protein